MSLILNDMNLETPINIVLQEGITVIVDNSGTGKTYLFSLIQSYAEAHNLSCLLINSSNYKGLKPMFPCDVILLDNADLYASRDYFNECYKYSKYVLCSIKYPACVPVRLRHMCSLRTTNGVLEVK